MAISDQAVEAALTFWYPGEWPDNLGLPGGAEQDDKFRIKARKEMREALEAAQAASLQPIASAPQDETPFLGWNIEYGFRETLYSFHGEGSISHARWVDGNGERGSFWWSEPQSNWGSSWKPTHWMPLPSTPA